MFILLVEGVITFIIVAALFYVAPGVMGAVKIAAPVVYGTVNQTNAAGATGVYDPGLNSSVSTIGTAASGGLNLSSISMIMLGIGIMIGGFMLVRGYNQG